MENGKLKSQFLNSLEPRNLKLETFKTTDNDGTRNSDFQK